MLRFSDDPSTVTIRAWHPDWWRKPLLIDFSTLEVGDTRWIGPILTADPFENWLDAHSLAARASKAGVHVSGQVIDRYIRFHRHRQLPTNWGGLLSLDRRWDEMSVGEVLMVHPEPTNFRVEEAAVEAFKFRYRRVGHFSPYIGKGGFLWVRRSELDHQCQVH